MLKPRLVRMRSTLVTNSNNKPLKHNMKFKYFKFELMMIFLFASVICNAGGIVINNNTPDKVITFGNSKIMVTLDYNGKCNISELSVNGQMVISGPEGIFSEIKTAADTLFYT